MPRNATIFVVDVNIRKHVRPETFHKFRKKIDDRTRQRANEKKRNQQIEKQMRKKSENEQRIRRQEQVRSTLIAVLGLDG